MTILSTIVEKKKEEVLEGKYASVGERVSVPYYSFYNALAQPNRDMAIIAEVKKASPSKGKLVDTFDHVQIAKTYESLDVDCISVLTDESFFQGHSTFLTDIKKVIKKPIIRKDFIISEQQIYHSKEIGADAILLIASILEKNQLREYVHLAESLQLDVLLEVHDEGDLEKVLSVLTPKIIGINNRNLKTFHTTIHQTEKLRSLIPTECIVISESGIKEKEDVDFLRTLDVDGMLVGEAFMVNENKKELLRDWFS